MFFRFLSLLSSNSRWTYSYLLACSSISSWFNGLNINLFFASSSFRLSSSGRRTFSWYRSSNDLYWGRGWYDEFLACANYSSSLPFRILERSYNLSSRSYFSISIIFCLCSYLSWSRSNIRALRSCIVCRYSRAFYFASRRCSAIFLANSAASVCLFFSASANSLLVSES